MLRNINDTLLQPWYVCCLFNEFELCYYNGFSLVNRWKLSVEQKIKEEMLFNI